MRKRKPQPVVFTPDPGDEFLCQLIEKDNYVVFQIIRDSIVQFLRQTGGVLPAWLLNAVGPVLTFNNYAIVCNKKKIFVSYDMLGNVWLLDVVEWEDARPLRYVLDIDKGKRCKIRLPYLEGERSPTEQLVDLLTAVFSDNELIDKALHAPGCGLVTLYDMSRGDGQVKVQTDVDFEDEQDDEYEEEEQEGEDSTELVGPESGEPLPTADECRAEANDPNVEWVEVEYDPNERRANP